MPDWLNLLGQTLLVGALTFVVLAVLTSHLRFQSLTRRASGEKAPGATARPLFELQIAQQLGTAHRNPRPFVLARIALAASAQLRELHGEKALVELVEKTEEALKQLLRSDDVVSRLNDDEIGVLLGARRDSGEKAIRRVLRALSSSPVTLASGLSIRVDAIAGMASYPEDGERAPELHERAGIALSRARADGRGICWPAESAGGAMLPKRDEEADGASVLDELTGVLKQERVGTALQKFVAARRKDDLPVSVLSLDIDSLRRYNKQYGEEVGNTLLRGFAQFLQNNTRESDLIARWTEDQFLVALHCAPAEALLVAQRLAADARKTSFGRDGLRITVTVGVSGWPGHSGNARGLFDEAQLALRVGKSKGRNQCILFEEAMRKLSMAAAPAESF